MQAIILAAGYATRLYPLTLNTPKPLLRVAGKPMIEHILANLSSLNINRIFIVTNDKFKPHFDKWLLSYEPDIAIEIINDGTKNNEDRLGALGDIHFVIKAKNIHDDIVVIAGDNIFEMELADAFKTFQKRKSDLIVCCDVKDFNLARQYGIVEQKNDKVESFEEKPANPKSTLASTGIYFFTSKTIGLIRKYIDQGNNADKSGSFIEWLHKRENVYVFVTDRKWYDIGSFDQLEKADKHYKK